MRHDDVLKPALMRVSVAFVRIAFPTFITRSPSNSEKSMAMVTYPTAIA